MPSVREFSRDSDEVFNFVVGLNVKYRHGGEIKVPTIGVYVAKEFSFGQLDYHEERLEFSEHQLIKLNFELKRVTGHNPAHGKPTAQPRVPRSRHNHSTKLRAQPVTSDFVLVNCLGQLNINHQQHSMPTINSLGIYININEVLSIEHTQLILVENLALMASLADLVLPASINEPLFIYRGDLKPEQSVSSAYQFFRHWSSSHQLICFSDFDPAGLIITLGSGANFSLMPAMATWPKIFTVELEGSEENWWQQQEQRTAINNLIDNGQLSQHLAASFQKMADHRRTWQQEHMISHQTELSLIALN